MKRRQQTMLSFLSVNVDKRLRRQTEVHYKPKSPVSSSSPWASNNCNVMPARRRSSFEDGVDARPSSPQVENGELPEERVFVTHVESPVMFWAQTAEHEAAQAIEKMSSDLQIYCRNKPLLQSTPHIDKVYGGVYPEDKQWYRCRVKELVEEDKVSVHFVDYGNTDVISLRTIVFLSHENLSLVPFAQLFCLDGVVATNSDLYDKGVNVLHDLPMASCLMDDSEGGVGNIANELIKQGLVMAIEQLQDGPPPLSPRKVKKLLTNYGNFILLKQLSTRKNMEQAVNHKCLELVSKVSELKTMRDEAPANGKTSEVIRETIDLTRNNRIVLGSLKSLQQVQESESNLQQAQECLRHCKDKEELLTADMFPKEIKARQDLFDTIDLFCQEVDLIPLQEREKSLRYTSCPLGKCMHLTSFKKQQEALDSYSTDPVHEGAVEAYEQWLERSHQDVTEVRQKVKCVQRTLQQHFLVCNWL
ncbi:RNA catabolic process [Desmophyllum pertusum]|uniref:RNA catabolic process n=1 Tax=Desmophyllum pertusum TaxID=174260 RepID=A0A9W9ZG73_9CNID|nr:RNA catabolic process [Desmophyllum pertusum]